MFVIEIENVRIKKNIFLSTATQAHGRCHRADLEEILLTSGTFILKNAIFSCETEEEENMLLNMLP